MAFANQVTPNPRPQCPECGQVVDPETAFFWKLPEEPSGVDRACIGIYCRADCLLDARKRGWPFWRIKGQQS